MFSINASVAQSTKETPYEIAFGQQPRLDGHACKSIEGSIKEKRRQEVIVQEDLSYDIVDMMKEMDQVEPELIDSGNTEIINQDGVTVTCNVVAAVNDTNDYGIQDEEDTHHDFNIDYEELVDGNESLLSDACANIDSIEIDQYTQIREDQETYLSNAHTKLTRYMSRSAKRKRKYAIDDVVGLKVERNVS